MNASESVFRGAEGTGEAQILQGNGALKGLLQAQRLKQQQAMMGMRYGYQAMQMRNQRDNALLKSDFSKPGTFQQEESLKEINDVGDLTRKYAQQNPYASRLDIENAIGPEKNKVEQNIARRNEVQATLKEYQQAVTKDKAKYDPEALSRLHDKIFSQEDPTTGKISNKHIQDIDPNAIPEILNHPSVINPHTAIVDAVAPIKQQMEMSQPGQDVINTGLGLMKEGTTNKMRFMKEDGTPGISDGLVNYVLEKNPAIENKFFWEVAQENVKAAGGDPNNLDKVQEVYDHIRHTDDPSILLQIHGKTKADLEQLQQVSKTNKYTNLGKFSATEKAQPTPEDYAVTDKQIKTISNDFSKGAISVETHSLLNNLTNKRYNGMYILKAEPDIEKNSVGEDKRRIKLTLKLGTAGGFMPKVDAQNNIMTNSKGEPILDYNAPSKSNATETVFMDPNNHSALFDLLKSNHPEKKAKQMGWNGLEDYRKGLSPEQTKGDVSEAEQFKLK